MNRQRTATSELLPTPGVLNYSDSEMSVNRCLSRAASFVLSAVVVFVALPAWAGNGASLVSLVPDSAQAVVGVNVEQLRSTSLFQQALTIARANSDSNEAMSSVTFEGFDPVSTASTIVLASTDVSDDAGDRMLVLVETTYPSAGLVAHLTTESYALVEGSTNLYRKGQSAVALLTDGLLALGHYDLVSVAVANHASGSGGPGSSLLNQIGSVDQGGSVWIAGSAPSEVRAGSMIRGSINLSSGIAAAAVLTMDNEEAAGSLATDITAQVAQLAGMPEVAGLGLASLLNGVSASASGIEVSLNLALDQAAWDLAVNTIGALIEEELR
ncbi:MAG: hypothetical protein ACI81R_000097 [Bradymonadia bacterium]